MEATIDFDADKFFTFRQDYLGIGLLGGIKYFVCEHLYLSALARIDFYKTIKDDSSNIEDLDELGNPAIFNKIYTDGWMPLSLVCNLGITL